VSAASHLGLAAAAARATSGRMSEARTAARDSMYRPHHGGANALDRAWHRITSWIGEFFGWLASLLPHFHIGLGGATIPSGLLYLVLAVALLVVVVFAVRGVLSSPRPTRRERAAAAVPATPFDVARAEALRLALTDPREGLRVLYGALLAELGRRRGWRPVPGRSNWAFVRRLGSNSAEGTALAECTRLFEGRVYGAQPAAAADVSRVSELAEAVLA
jgi:hypothetical protein